MSTTSSLFQGTAPPNVNTSTTATTGLAPGFSDYQSYLNNLAQAGNTALATPSSNLVAPLSSNQINAFAAAPSAAKTYQTPLTSAETTAGTAAGGVGTNQINNFLNPYITDVNKALETATQQNVNQTVLPALQAFGAGSGNTGSSRLINATGQTLGQIQQGLGAQESANLATGYQNAVTNALQEQQNLGNIANVQGNLATSGQNAANAALTEQATLGAQQQAQNQAVINAPLTQATNASQLLKGYTVPTTSTTNYSGPASVYGPSPLSQVAGLGSLIGAVGSSGLGTTISDALSKGASGLSNIFGNLFTGSNVSTGSTGDTFGGTGASSSGTMDYSGSSTGKGNPGEVVYGSNGQPTGYYNSTGDFVSSGGFSNSINDINNTAVDMTNYGVGDF